MPYPTIRFFAVVAVVSVIVAMTSTLSARAPQAAAAVPTYTFQIADVVEFKYPFTPELDFSAPVRPDGAIFFPYLGDVPLFGRTVSDLSALLQQKYADILKSPEITITVRSFQIPRVFVTGEVVVPGAMDFRHGMTLAQALYASGGFRDTANRKHLVLLRKASPEALRVIPVSLARAEDSMPDLVLQPNDILLVPRSRISRLGQIIQQYSRDLLPIASLGVFFNLVGSTGASVAFGGGQ